MSKVMGIWNITERRRKIFCIWTFTDENQYCDNSRVWNASENVELFLTNSNEKNLNSDLVFCIIIDREQKYCDRLDNCAWSEKPKKDK